MMDYTSWPVIGEGSERICYQNPANPTHCIKIIRQSRFKQTLREIHYFRYLKTRESLSTICPGFTAKSGGHNELIGIEQELIHDIPITPADSGKRRIIPVRPGRTIRQYLCETHTAQRIPEFLKAFDELKRYLLRYNIPAPDISHNNIVVRYNRGNIRMILVNGVYDTEWIPVSRYFRFFGKRKILRRWGWFMSTLREMYPQLG